MRRAGRLLFVALVFVPCAASPQGGNPLGPEFRVNTYTTSSQDVIRPWPRTPPATSSSSGRASTRTARADGVFGQRYASSGAPLGPEFRVNTYTTGHQALPGRGLGRLRQLRRRLGEPTRTARATASSASATPAPARPSVPSSASTRTRRMPRTIRPWPRTPPATSSSSGRATPGRLELTASSASATPAPARPSVPSSASTRTRRVPSAIRPWPRTPPATSSSSGRAATRTARLRRLRPALRQHRRAPRSRVPRQHLHDEYPGPSGRGLGLLRQLRRRLAELRPGRLGLRRLRPALRQHRRAPRSRVPRQHVHDG